MKLLVPVKRVIDFNVKVRLNSKGEVETKQVKMSMNPFDEIAIEAAIRLKEAGIIQEIIATTIATDLTFQEVLRHALALGADRSLFIHTTSPLEPLNRAKILAHLAKKEEVSLIILGKQAIDDDANQTGQMLAALLNWPQATFASFIEIKNNKALVTREVDGGLETLEVQLPAVITTDLRLNEPRFATLPNIMKAKTKPLEIIPLEQLALNLKTHEKSLKLSLPKERSPGKKVQTIKELMQILKEEEKVLP